MSSQLLVLRKYTAPDYESFLSKWASRSYPPHPDILSALRSFFLDTSIPNSQIVKRAVDHMIKQQTEEPSQCGPSCGPLFMVLRDVVKAYPAHNDRFIEFVVELQDISFPGGTFKDQMYKMGQDLTEFEFGQIEPSPFDSNIIPERQGYINLCAFIAKLHNRGIRTADKISDLSRGAQVLTEALEEAPWEKHHHEDIEAYLPQESEIEDDEDEDFYE